MNRRGFVACGFLFATFLCAAASSAAGPRVPNALAAGTVTLQAPNGRPGGQVGLEHGSDQGEDQGENIQQFARGTRRIGPTTVTATNSTTAGPASGGNGGNIVATFENRVVTTCGSETPHVIPLPETVQLTAGNGAKGGSSGSGQGADQGEDQGENIGQRAFVAANIGPTAVNAVNTNTSHESRGGSGGNVTIVFHTITTCVPAGTTPQTAEAAPPTVTKDAQGNIHAVYSAVTKCEGTPPQAYVIRAGNGGAGGAAALDQGSDQGEDQGENIGQFSSGGVRGGPTKVHATNTLSSEGATGGNGAGVNVTFDNTIELTCESAKVTLPAAPALRAVAGTGGPGGKSGIGQGSDQGEDQGENIGKDAKDSARIGPVRDTATNLNVSDNTSGGHGGTVSVLYNDGGTCAARPVTEPDERLQGRAGVGGPGGESGTEQGSDQGEDQGENIGQFAQGRVTIGDVHVEATNTNRSGIALGGGGGKVEVGYKAGSCAPPADSRGELVTATAGNGGKGGSSGKEQGADQGEDQGENIGQHAQRSVRFGHITVHAVNLNVSADAGGGPGGSVFVRTGSPTCATPSASPDGRVRAHPGSGGPGGSTGHGQGSDQGEDQGENIGNRGKGGISRGQTSVSASNHGQVGKAGAGAAGEVHSFACAATSQARRLTSVSSSARVPVPCTKTFSSSVYDVIVPAKRTCRLTARARIRHTVEVEVGGTLIDAGARIEQDVVADGAAGIRILGGSVGHDVAIEATAASAPGGNRICGVRVEHDLLVEASHKKSGVFTVGGIKGCAGNVAGHDLVVADNLGGAVVARNRAGHNAECIDNASLKGGANKAPRANTCPRRPL
jgi:hypothetical protein